MRVRLPGVRFGFGSARRGGACPRPRWRGALPCIGLVVSLVLGALCPPVEAKKLAVVTDGKFDEWKRRKPRTTDPRGDGASSGVDLGRLWLADDGETLFLRLEVGRETLIQNPLGTTLGNRLRLYLDADAKKATGTPLGSLGVDLEIHFGEREILSYDADGAGTRHLPGTGIYQAMPTHSSDAFEIRIQLPPRETGARSAAAKRRKVKLLLREELPDGDRLPDSGVVTYKMARKKLGPPRAIELARSGDRALRILSVNVENGLIAVVPELYTRVFQLLQPDIICIQSLRDWNAEETLAFVDEVLPGPRWEVAHVDDIHTVSSFPIAASEAIDNNLVTHIRLPGNRGERDLVLFNIHPPCCDNDGGRDAEVDNLMKTWRDLLEGGGPFAIAADDAMVIAGDFNMVGFERQVRALRDGIFVNPANGPDFAPGRGEGSLREAPLRHTHRRLIHTWRRTASAFAPGRLDWVLYTGDALEHLKSFVPDTGGMPEEFLEAHGLEATDSIEMSDHLPLVVDFEVRDR